MDYTTLSQTVMDYVDNQEPTFLDMLPTFIRQAEERIYRAVMIPESRKNVSGATTIGNPYLSRPDDYIAMLEFAITDSGSSYYLSNKDVSFLKEAYPTTSTQGRPKFYAEFDGDADGTPGHLILGPTPDQEYSVELHYYANPPSIVDAGTSWIGDNGSAALLYGTLVEAYTFMKGDADLLKQYTAQYKEALALVSAAAKRLRRDDYRNGQVG